MSRIPASAATCRSLLVMLLAAGCSGGGDGGGTAPPTVASVAITVPAAPIAFQTVTRTSQFTAVARDASSATVAGATITWNSTLPAVATVSGTGLVTAVGNGSTSITATSSGITSPAVMVSVAQFVAAVNVTPGLVAFGALGSTRQLTAVAVDSSGAAVAGAAAPTWTKVGTGAIANVSVAGLVTALAVGLGDTAVATVSAKEGKAPITVAQLVASILVNSTGVDSLWTTGRTKQYTAVVRDSQNNVMGGPAVAWSSSAPGVASVGAGTGLATAATDGNTNIIATANAINGQRALTVRRYAETFTLSPGAATIVTPRGTQIFLGTAQDSVATNLPISWVSRTTAAVSLSSNSGVQVTATAEGNGSSRIVMSGGTRSDSALVTVSGQATAPLTASVLVGDTFFRSVRNNTEDEAIDSVAVGGTVTWTWQSGSHSVRSILGPPSFPSSGIQAAGTVDVTFNAAGTYRYDCGVHGASMSGRIIVL